jgi:hypothetical protein
MPRFISNEFLFTGAYAPHQNDHSGKRTIWNGHSGIALEGHCAPYVIDDEKND